MPPAQVVLVASFKATLKFRLSFMTAQRGLQTLDMYIPELHHTSTVL
jgi:hypothetical protein